ncbi:nitroreductase family protein [Litorimonas sp. RW-G-Af-16]|uniref:nitroreductase family protein n=1 Tax=Litorimonas sp. RW-G-Af-16 TaxID=3241168 RepID=UPI003AAFCA06
MKLTNDPAVTVTDALNTRITVRDFQDMPVPEETLRQILTTAQRSASGGNLQPWHVHVMTGEKLAGFKEDALAMAQAGHRDEPTHQAYPSPLWEPQRSWRYKLGEDMYGLIGIEKDNKMGSPDVADAEHQILRRACRDYYHGR